MTWWDAWVLTLRAKRSHHAANAQGFQIDKAGLVHDQHCVDLVRVALGLDCLYLADVSRRAGSGR